LYIKIEKKYTDKLQSATEAHVTVQPQKKHACQCIYTSQTNTERNISL
jgi:hypothetical protein